MAAIGLDAVSRVAPPAGNRCCKPYSRGMQRPHYLSIRQQYRWEFNDKLIGSFGFLDESDSMAVTPGQLTQLQNNSLDNC